MAPKPRLSENKALPAGWRLKLLSPSWPTKGTLGRKDRIPPWQDVERVL